MYIISVAELCQSKKCGAYAFCDANECICQNGYHGNPYVKCERKLYVAK